MFSLAKIPCLRYASLLSLIMISDDSFIEKGIAPIDEPIKGSKSESNETSENLQNHNHITLLVHNLSNYYII